MSNSEDDVLKKRANKIINFIKGKNIYLIAILVFALLIRLYYFFLTKDQALWWDALSYGSISKNFIYGAWTDLPLLAGEIVIRPALLPFFWSLLMKASFSEIASKFILQLIPSFLSVLFVYLIGKEMYGKRIGLISATIMSFLWMHLFYSVRMLTSVPALFFSLVSIYYFIRAGEDFKQKEFFLSIFFISIAILIRYPMGLIGASYIVFLVLTQKLNFLKKKSFWTGGILGIIPILIFFSINLFTKGNIFPAAGNYAASAAAKTSYALYTFGLFDDILRMPLFLLFIIGLIMVLSSLILGFDLIKKSKNLKSHLLNLLFLVTTLIFLVFLIKRGEDRYLFTAILPMVFFAAITINFLYLKLRKHNKILSVLLMISLLGAGFYSNFLFGDSLIKNKKESFSEMKEVFLWMNENIPKGSTIIGESSELYVIYYTEGFVPKTWAGAEMLTIVASAATTLAG